MPNKIYEHIKSEIKILIKTYKKEVNFYKKNNIAGFFIIIYLIFTGGNILYFFTHEWNTFLLLSNETIRVLIISTGIIIGLYSVSITKHYKGQSFQYSTLIFVLFIFILDLIIRDTYPIVSKYDNVVLLCCIGLVFLVLGFRTQDIYIYKEKRQSKT